MNQCAYTSAIRYTDSKKESTYKLWKTRHKNIWRFHFWKCVTKQFTTWRNYWLVTFPPIPVAPSLILGTVLGCITSKIGTPNTAPTWMLVHVLVCCSVDNYGLPSIKREPIRNRSPEFWSASGPIRIALASDDCLKLFFISTFVHYEPWAFCRDMRSGFLKPPALVGGEWLASRPGLFTPRERVPSIYYIGMYTTRVSQWVSYKWI
jgi:hypothetical protein